MTVHTKILERRREVAEDVAKRSLGRLLKLLFVLFPAAVIAWVAFSPWLSVSAVVVDGAEAGAVYEILARHRVAAGTPMVLIDAARVETELEQDPWIAEATVTLSWPDRIVVSIVEHVPLAWVQTPDGWVRRSRDASPLPSPPEPDASLPTIILTGVDGEQAGDSRELLGALELVEALPQRLRQTLVVQVDEGQLWAEVAGHRVRLGRPVEMTAKAMSLTSLLATRVPDGSEINLVAPTHPAVGPATGGRPGPRSLEPRSAYLY